MDFLISQTETAPSSSIEADPDFVGPIQNVTVAVGREAVLSCTVTDLGTYRVSELEKSDQFRENPTTSYFYVYIICTFP